MYKRHLIPSGDMLRVWMLCIDSKGVRIRCTLQVFVQIIIPVMHGLFMPVVHVCYWRVICA